MNKTLMKMFFVGFAFLSASCGQREDSAVQSMSATESPLSQFSDRSLLSNNRFHLITPTGARIYAAGKAWEKKQEAEAKYYAQPAMCATNASRVLEMAGVRGYSSPLLMTMVNAARKRGAWVIQLPKKKSEIAARLKTVFNGKIPVGSFVSGCLRPDCSGQAGDGHIALVGDVDSSGYIKIYHNNWYRPDNHADRLWRPYMIPMDWYNKGFRRKWMATPWIYIHRDQQGAPVDISVPLPDIDDLDPTNYYLTLTIPFEILSELRAGQGVVTDGKGGVLNQMGQPFDDRNSPRDADPKQNDTPAVQPCQNVLISDPNDPAGVNLRSVSTGRVLCQLPNQTRATLVEQSGDWSLVSARCGGVEQEGYVFTKLTKKVSCHAP